MSERTYPTNGGESVEFQFTTEPQTLGRYVEMAEQDRLATALRKLADQLTYVDWPGGIVGTSTIDEAADVIDGFCRRIRQAGVATASVAPASLPQVPPETQKLPTMGEFDAALLTVALAVVGGAEGDLREAKEYARQLFDRALVAARAALSLRPPTNEDTTCPTPYPGGTCGCGGQCDTDMGEFRRVNGDHRPVGHLARIAEIRALLAESAERGA